MNDPGLSLIDNSQEEVFEYWTIVLDMFEAYGYILNHISKKYNANDTTQLHDLKICINKYDMLMIDILI